jgi:HlyD family secretion protein
MNKHVALEIEPSARTRALVTRVPLIPTRLKLSRWFIGAAIVIVLGAVLAYWLTRGEAVTHYATGTVTRGAVTRVVSGSGTVNPVLTILVGTYVSGVIQSISCDFNTKVKKGQLCAKIDPRPFQTAVNQAAANLATAKAQLVKDTANLAYAKVSYERNTKLVAMGGASQDALDVAKNAYDQAQAQIVLDEASIKQHEAALEAAQVNLDYTNIISPVDGTVVSRNVTVGQTVAASFQTPTMFLIATDLTKMEVDTNVSESDIGAIKVGNRASFTVEAHPEKVFDAVVSQVRQAPQTVQNVVTYDVVLTVDNTELLLKPGMTATTRIVTAERQDVLRVPDQGLRFNPVGAASTDRKLSSAQGQVWILENGLPRAVPVKLGLDDDTRTEVLEGALKPGDEVIVRAEQIPNAGSTSVARPRLFGF